MNSTNYITNTIYSPYGSPELIDTILSDHKLELVYQQRSNYTYTVSTAMGSAFPECYPRIYKDVYEIVDGKLTKTRTVEGEYVPPQEESYTFPGEPK